MKNGRVAIVYPWPNFDTVPSLCNAALLLSQRGYMVDVFTHVSHDYEVPYFDGNGINLRVSRSETFLSNVARSKDSVNAAARTPPLRLTLLHHCKRAIMRLIDLASWFESAIQTWWLHRAKPFKCFIGVDPHGLLQAHFLARFLRVPVVYYSLELLPSDEASNPVHKRLKSKEIATSRRAAFVIIQDQERARLLGEDNQIPLEKCVLVPNAPLGPARRKPSRHWHRQFDLSSDVRIVLHAGSIEPWTGIGEIADAVGSWPENWVLVIHTRHHAESSTEVERLRGSSSASRIFFSLKPVSRQEYGSLVDGADIGVAFYVPTVGSPTWQRNIQAVGLSSGKVAYYLRAGLPVIVNDQASISELVQREACGKSVRHARDIGVAIAEIAWRYQEYSYNACKVFDGYFDFARGFEKVASRIDSLSSGMR